MDYKKPITFRPTDEDAGALSLLAEKNPIMKANTVDLIRVALQDYVFNHGPDAKRSKSARLGNLEGDMAEIKADMASVKVDMMAVKQVMQLLCDRGGEGL